MNTEILDLHFPGISADLLNCPPELEPEDINLVTKDLDIPTRTLQ